MKKDPLASLYLRCILNYIILMYNDARGNSRYNFEDFYYII